MFNQSEKSIRNEQLYIESLADQLKNSCLHKDLNEGLRLIVTEY